MPKKLVKSESFAPAFNRIIEVCERRSISVSNLLDYCGLSRSAMNAWKNGNINTGIVAKISEYLNISAEYIITGKEIFSEISDAEKNLLEIYSRLSEVNRARLMERAEILAEIQEKEALSRRTEINSQEIVGVSIARTANGEIRRQSVTNEELELINSLPEETDF